ncbi:uncharacterized protein LOC117327448 isoform X2 [Pecten maximus]|uniref:uncharacterized protein LOC117327448 isoform X2 n=1 Tax=Pecten maximus TaxID=6579 RepID=UPI001458B833|nr:uncharacterized protein LOC117327448 isoform X2 [Pecten maximus]
MAPHNGCWASELDRCKGEHMIKNDTAIVEQFPMDQRRLQMLRHADELKTPHDREAEVEFIVKQDTPDIILLEYLLEFGTVVKDTLLKCAVCKGHVDVVKILLDHRADIKLGDAFEWAVIGGNLKMISLLLKRGADPNHFIKLFVYKGFVLGIAVMKGRICMDIHVMKELLDYGADLKEGVVYTVRGSNMEKTKDMLERPDHKNNTVVTPCALMGVLNHNLKEAVFGRWKDIELTINVQHISFNGITSKWTPNYHPTFSKISVLLSYKLDTSGKDIHKKKSWKLWRMETCYHFWKHVREFLSENALDDEVMPAKMVKIDFPRERDFLSLYLNLESTKCKEQKQSCFENSMYENDDENNVIENNNEDSFGDNDDENDADGNDNENNSDENDKENKSDENDKENIVDENGKENIVDENGKTNIMDEDDKGNNMDRNDTENSVDENRDENDIDENDTGVSGYEECTWDEEYPDVEKLLPSKSMLEESDQNLQGFENENSYTNERYESFADLHKRLETFLFVIQEGIDLELLACAGFFNTGESDVLCFCCGVEIGFEEITDNPWKEHVKRSPGCAYLSRVNRRSPGCAYLSRVNRRVNVEQEFKEGNETKHSEMHPADVKGKIDLMRERKFLDPPDGGIGICEADFMQKHNDLESLILFDDKDRNERGNILMVKTKHFFKGISDMEFHHQKVVNRRLIQKTSKEALELIRPLRQQSYHTQLFIYIVQDVMSRLSSFSLWPHRNIRTGPLVEAGFSCKDPQTATVKCTACGLELNVSTLSGTTPLEYHKKNSPDCEFFHEPKLQNADGEQVRTSTSSSNTPSLSVDSHGATAYADPQVSLDSTQTGDAGRPQSRSNLKDKDSVTKTPPGHDRNVFIDNAPSINNPRQTDSSSSVFGNNGIVSSDPIIADRPRTGEVFDRTALAVPNTNNVTSSGEAVREIENTILGAEGGNAPYPIRNARYTEQNARRESYTHWPHRRAHDIDLLVNAGFFYTGAEDIVRCFYCDIGLAEWNPDDDPWVEHARHSPECPYLRVQKGQDYINNIQTQWAKIYTPKHPQHSQVDERRRTFRNENWPRDNVLQSPELLAAAGFFYTGEGDTVRCHYCDGGLREWEPADDPWVEHARWFPFCKFVLKIKGIDFIQASATGNPGNGLQAPAAPPVAPHASEPPQALSFVDSCRIKEQRNPMYSAAAQSLKSMGYSKATIRMVIDSYIAHTGRRDFKATDLMDIIMRMEDAGQQFLESDLEDDDDKIGATASQAAAGGCDEEMELSAAAMKKENEYLREKFKCKVCDKNERCIVFVPCGHRITCQGCGEQASTCPHCDSKIEQRYKTYLG